MAALKPDGFRSALSSDPRRYNGALVFGPNLHLVERLKAETAACFQKLEPDLEIVNIKGQDVEDQPGKILEELQGLSLFGGYKLVIFDARSAAAYKECVSAISIGWENAWLLVTSGDLKKSVSLRKEFEASADLAAIVCYEQTSAELSRYVSGALGAAGFELGDGVSAAVVEAVSGNAALLDQELAKVTTYCHGMKSIDLADVEKICSGNRAVALDEFIDAVFLGDRAGTLARLRVLRSAGSGSSSALVALTNHFLLLRNMAVGAAQGGSSERIVKTWKPPVFWKRQSSVARQLDYLGRCDIASFEAAIYQANLDSRRNHLLGWNVVERLALALVSRVARA